MPAHSLGKLLHTDSGLARFSDHANRLKRLQRAFEAALPAALVRSGRVANLKQGIVVIHTTSGAAAAKIRQLAPRLTAAFCQSGAEVTQIQVKVQPAEPVAAVRQITGAGLVPVAKQGLEKLCSKLPEESPMRRALERFTRSVRVKEQ